jgi:hypothetical protein
MIPILNKKPEETGVQKHSKVFLDRRYIPAPPVRKMFLGL